MVYRRKQEGLYQNKVNSSLISHCNCKMGYFIPQIFWKKTCLCFQLYCNKNSFQLDVFREKRTSKILAELTLLQYFLEFACLKVSVILFRFSTVTITNKTKKKKENSWRLFESVIVEPCSYEVPQYQNIVHCSGVFVIMKTPLTAKILL